jgi:hypothetical protein
MLSTQNYRGEQNGNIMLSFFLISKFEDLLKFCQRKNTLAEDENYFEKQRI